MMKYTLAILFLLFIVWLGLKFVGCSFKKGVFKAGIITPSGYHVRDNRVYYYGGLMNAYTQELAEVDAATFEIVRLEEDIPGLVSSSNFARDKSHVYWRGRIIPGADPASFKALGAERSRDKNHLYTNLRAFSDNPDHYRHLIGDLYIDTNHIYWDTEIISDEPHHLRFTVRADSSSSLTYFADSKGVFASNGMRMKGVDAATFKALPGNYCADASRVYVFDVLELKVVEGADPGSFKLVGNKHALDRDRAYWGSKAIAESDPDTFEKLNDRYAKDKNRAYYKEKPIPDSDPHTFRLFQDKLTCASDKNHVYFGDRIIPNADPANLPKGKKCRFCDEEQIVFEE